MMSLGNEAKAGSASASFFEAIRFSIHVMGIPFEAGIIFDRRLTGRARRLQGLAAGSSRQAPDLSLERVAKLERFVCSDEACEVDRYLVDGFLKIQMVWHQND